MLLLQKFNNPNKQYVKLTALYRYFTSESVHFMNLIIMIYDLVSVR